MHEPLLSVITITYNHEPFIAKTIEGVLMQKTSFPIEYIIAEDCSTDNTRNICFEYANKNPNTIKLITSDNNVGFVENEKRGIRAARGKYIAFCEGDDYWTDPLKLQKQVDFLELHPEYSVTFHRYQIRHMENDQWSPDDLGYLFDGNHLDGVDVNTYMFLHRWITQYLTIVYRKDAFDLSIADKYTYYRDSHLIYHLLEAGKGYIFSFVGGVYNRTGNGVYATLSQYKMQKVQIAVFEELWKQNNDNRVREMYAFNVKYLLDSFKPDNTNRKELLNYAFRLFMIDKRLGKLIKNIIKTLK